MLSDWRRRSPAIRAARKKRPEEIDLESTSAGPPLRARFFLSGGLYVLQRDHLFDPLHKGFHDLRFFYAAPLRSHGLTFCNKPSA